MSSGSFVEEYEEVEDKRKKQKQGKNKTLKIHCLVEETERETKETHMSVAFGSRAVFVYHSQLFFLRFCCLLFFSLCYFMCAHTLQCKYKCCTSVIYCSHCDMCALHMIWWTTGRAVKTRPYTFYLLIFVSSLLLLLLNFIQMVWGMTHMAGQQLWVYAFGWLIVTCFMCWFFGVVYDVRFSVLWTACVCVCVCV